MSKSVLTHLRLCCEISSDKVGREQPNTLVCFSFPPVGVTKTQIAEQNVKWELLHQN